MWTAGGEISFYRQECTPCRSSTAVTVVAVVFFRSAVLTDMRDFSRWTIEIILLVYRLTLVDMCLRLAEIMVILMLAVECYFSREHMAVSRTHKRVKDEMCGTSEESWLKLV